MSEIVPQDNVPVIDEDLAKNYRQLAAERGTTVDKLAPEHDEYSPRLAAWMRAQAVADPAKAPKGRRTTASAQETAEADQGEQA